MGIGIIPATLLVGAGAVWLGMPSLVVLVVCAVVIALGAFAVSRDGRTLTIALVVAALGAIKFLLFGQPAMADLLHTKYASFSFLYSDWLVGVIAAISIPLSGLFGFYGPLQGSYRVNLFNGSVARFLVTFAAWLSLSGALYAHFSGRDHVAIAVGVVTAVFFLMSFRVGAKADAHA